MTENKRSRSLVWPLVLISAGVLFLLNNLGLVSWNIWSILWRMWPVLIVAIGLDLIFGRRSGVWSAIIVVVVIGLIAGAIWLFDFTGNAWAGEKISQTILQELGKADNARVQIKLNVGRMEIYALPVSSEYLVTGDVEISEFETLVDDLRVSGDTIYYTLSSEEQQYQPNWLFNSEVDNNKNWDLLLNQDVMLDLDIDTGVGQSVIDLSELQLTNLDVKTGVGEVTVYLPGEGDLQANIKAGVGQMEIYLPANLAVRIHVNGGLGNVNVHGDFNHNNGDYFTKNYNTSSDRLELYVDGGVGNIRIVQAEN